jgi:hypothetical protein
VFACNEDSQTCLSAAPQHFFRYSFRKSIPGNQKTHRAALTPIGNLPLKERKPVVAALPRPVLAFGYDE